jgi:1,4-alpha-glucan branching enzyme
MLFQGQEMLEVAGFDFPSPPALDWSNADRFAPIMKMYRDLIAMRRNLFGETRGLSGNNTRVHHRNDGDKVLAWHRWDRGGPGDDVIVIANFANKSFDSYLVGLPTGGTWKVRFHGDAKVYSADFGGGSGSDVIAENVGRDGMPFRGSVVLRPYSLVVLSQSP